ncbi:MAG TPA: tetratricopeptide repeat protein [Burkholderiales bacterium]|jgi:predicted negative regulator of RcsB-dependent stress response
MAALDLEEQEQLDELKAWWNRYGNLVLTAIILVMLVIAGFNAWRYYQRSQSAAAYVLYDELQNVSAAKDKAKSAELAGQLLERYPRTTFAPLAALTNARVQQDAGDAKAAQAQLQWVVDSGKDEDLRNVARVRLAGLLLDQKKYDDALKLMAAAHPASFDAVFLDRKGDILFAQGKTADARAAWQDAYAKADAKDTLRQVIQLKLELAGGSAAKATS